MRNPIHSLRSPFPGVHGFDNVIRKSATYSMRSRFALLIFMILSSGAIFSQTVTGELRQWHDVALTFDGPATSESAEPNPFLNYRLNVTFTKGRKRLLV